MQSLAAQLGNGEAVSAAYVKHRKAIENQHGNDDGTAIHYERQHGDRREYLDDLPDPLSDASPTIRLREFGLTPHYCEVLDRNGAYTISLVREALRRQEIHEWPGCQRKTEADIRAAVERMDAG